VASLLPVLLPGHVLARSFDGEANQRGLDLRRAVAAAVADIAQGFLLARPMPIEALEAWLREVRADVAPTSAAL
jgi:hypothetical protein